MNYDLYMGRSKILRPSTCLLSGSTPGSAAQCRHCSSRPLSAESPISTLLMIVNQVLVKQ